MGCSSSRDAAAEATSPSPINRRQSHSMNASSSGRRTNMGRSHVTDESFDTIVGPPSMDRRIHHARSPRQHQQHQQQQRCVQHALLPPPEVEDSRADASADHQQRAVPRGNNPATEFQRTVDFPVPALDGGAFEESGADSMGVDPPSMQPSSQSMRATNSSLQGTPWAGYEDPETPLPEVTVANLAAHTRSEIIALHERIAAGGPMTMGHPRNWGEVLEQWVMTVEAPNAAEGGA